MKGQVRVWVESLNKHGVLPPSHLLLDKSSRKPQGKGSFLRPRAGHRVAEKDLQRQTENDQHIPKRTLRNAVFCACSPFQ